MTDKEDEVLDMLPACEDVEAVLEKLCWTPEGLSASFEGVADCIIYSCMLVYVCML